MYVEDRRRICGDCVFVVPGVSLVGRPNFHQFRAGGGHHVGQAKGAADFDQLAAGDNHLPPLGDRVEHERGGRRVVVDHGDRFGPGQLPDEPLDPSVAFRALPGGDVGLQQRVTGELLGDLPDGSGRQNRPAQRGVQNHPGRVDDPAVMRSHRLADPLAGLAEDLAAEVLLIGPARCPLQEVLPRFSDRSTQGIDHDPPRRLPRAR